jgi:hypothetical protein
MRRVMAALGLVLVSQLSPSLAADLFASVEQAAELCKDSREWCVGFVTGALDGWAALEAYYSGEKFCLPADLSTGEIVDLFIQELGASADVVSEPASYILYEHLIERFPCQEESLSGSSLLSANRYSS